MNFTRLKNGFLSSLSGLKVLWKTEQNFKIEIIFGLIVIILAIILRLSLIELAILLLTIGLILFAEVINTNLEKTLDIIYPQLSKKVKCLKDFTSASILILAIISVLIGLIIFLPHLI